MALEVKGDGDVKRMIISANFVHSPNLAKFAELLNLSRADAFFCLTKLWSWAAVFAPDGIIEFNAGILAEAAGYDSELAIEFVGALTKTDLVELVGGRIMGQLKLCFVTFYESVDQMM